MTILFIIPHPDDEAFSMGGTIKRLANEGHRVVMIVVTDGSAGKSSIKLEGALLSQVRKDEVEKSTHILGINKTYFLNYVDGTLCNKDIKNSLSDKIGEIIEKESAEVVVTYDHTGVYWHIDHIVTSLATLLACKNHEIIVDKLFFFVPPEGFTILQGYTTAGRFPITHTVDISSVEDDKKRSIDAHTSQAADKVRYLKTLGESAFDNENYFLVLDNSTNQSIFDIFLGYKKTS